MANFFVSYDLLSPGQNYDEVIEKIKSYRKWAKVHMSLWYIQADETIESVAKNIRSAMDATDTLLVIDASNNNIVWYNLSPKVDEYLKGHWERGEAGQDVCA